MAASKATAVFYISGHGYGHATRAAALLGALRRLAPKLKLLVRTQAPHAFFKAAAADAICVRAAVDPGLLQKDALAVDRPASLSAHLKFLERWDEVVEAEAAALREAGADLVVGDIPPLAFAAAKRAAVPSVAVANFCWDWLLEEYAVEDARWREVCRRYAAAYAQAGTLYRLPLSGDFPAFRRVEETPLLCRRSAFSEVEAREYLGLGKGEKRPVVLLSFSGWGSGLSDLSGGDDLSDFLFAGFGEKPPGLKASWISLPDGEANAHADVLPACAAVLSKPGYGVISEVLAHKSRLLYLPRHGFRETPALLQGLAKNGCAAELPLEDFKAGRWRRHLEALVARRVPAPGLDLDGDEFIARRLLKLLG